MSKLFYIYFISIIIPLSIQNVISIGYEDNFMRFSDYEMDTNLYENGTENDYMGDSRLFDSSVFSPSTQITFNPKIDKYKTKAIFRLKYNEYQSSNQKSYLNFNFRYEVKLKSYNWIKFSYSLTPKYYLRTFIDRDLLPLTYYPCYFSNENVSISYSMPIKLIKKTWWEIKLNLNNQFYNKNFTEFDTKIFGFEGNLKTSYLNSYHFSIGYFYATADNITYGNAQFYESTSIDRSYKKSGIRLNGKKFFKNNFITSSSLKIKLSKRDYDLNSWYYEYDNWKKYYETEIVLEANKKINKQLSLQISAKHFNRDVKSSQSKETLWVEDYKIYSRNELWFKFIYNFRK
tara:strand:+ start:3718 stop:4752 length:1035 start_codon:yes stop_codon:yes gene_type:complete